jgi:hypothetical protein
MYKLLITSAIVSALLGCEKPADLRKNDDTLAIGKRPYTGKQLKIDGYYYSIYRGAINVVYVFFQNGVIQTFGVSDYGMDFSKVERDFTDPQVMATMQNNKYWWGDFAIDTNSIKIEHWQPSNGAFPVYTNEGTILNDTTFTLTTLYRLVNGQQKYVTAINEIYYFKKYSPKPDSTNNFVRY